jgi:hypothetical protein
MKDYVQLLEVLKLEALKLGLNLKPQQIMTDFELAAVNAFKNQFIEIVIKGCLFHFGQSLYKNLKKHQLTELYESNPEFNHWFRLVFSLSLVPLSDIDEVWAKIIARVPKFDDEIDEPVSIRPARGRGSRGPRGGRGRSVITATVKVKSATSTKLDNFIQYFVNTYFEGKFPMNFWNHFSTEDPRTNNNVEGYNNKLKCFVGAASPNIFKMVEIFKNEESSADKAFRKAVPQDISIKPSNPPPSKTHYADKNVELKLIKDLYNKKQISLETYLASIVSLYEFNRKKKYSNEDLTDSDDSVSDSGSDSDN